MLSFDYWAVESDTQHLDASLALTIRKDLPSSMPES